jgi:glycosyltransferase involved in cell wall biosynthesis
LVYITFNRLRYTRLSLPRLLADPSERFDLVIWDNGSTDGTAEFLRSVHDPRIREVVLRPANEGQAAATNYAWSRSDAELCGKVDNDCLVTPGWTRVLASAHAAISELGGIGCWHFMEEDFDLERAAPKLRRMGTHQIVVHPHIGGTGFLLKRKDYESFGPVDERLLSRFWIRLAIHGRINGWHYPLVLQEHMDDPRSSYCAMPERIEPHGGSWITRSRGLTTRADFERWIRDDAAKILGSPSEVTASLRWWYLRSMLGGWVRRHLA